MLEMVGRKRTVVGRQLRAMEIAELLGVELDLEAVVRRRLEQVADLVAA